MMLVGYANYIMLVVLVMCDFITIIPVRSILNSLQDHHKNTCIILP